MKTLLAILTVTLFVAPVQADTTVSPGWSVYMRLLNQRAAAAEDTYRQLRSELEGQIEVCALRREADGLSLELATRSCALDQDYQPLTRRVVATQQAALDARAFALAERGREAGQRYIYGVSP